MLDSSIDRDLDALDRLIAELEGELLELEEKRHARGLDEKADDLETVRLRQTIYVLKSRRFRSAR